MRITRLTLGVVYAVIALGCSFSGRAQAQPINDWVSRFGSDAQIHPGIDCEEYRLKGDPQSTAYPLGGARMTASSKRVQLFCPFQTTYSLRQLPENVRRALVIAGPDVRARLCFAQNVTEYACGTWVSSDPDNTSPNQGLILEPPDKELEGAFVFYIEVVANMPQRPPYTNFVSRYSAFF